MCAHESLHALHSGSVILHDPTIIHYFSNHMTMVFSQSRSSFALAPSIKELAKKLLAELTALSTALQLLLTTMNDVSQSIG